MLVEEKLNTKTDYCRTENVDIIEICNMYFRVSFFIIRKINPSEA
jgi:hypothetical protein